MPSLADGDPMFSLAETLLKRHIELMDAKDSGYVNVSDMVQVTHTIIRFLLLFSFLWHPLLTVLIMNASHCLKF